VVSPPRAGSSIPRSLLAFALALTVAIGLPPGGAFAEGTTVVPKQPSCPSLALQGSVLGREAPPFRIDAGKRAVLRLVAEACALTDWHTRTLTRTSGTLGPASVTNDTRIYSRRQIYQLSVTAPEVPGHYAITYELDESTGARAAGPVTIDVEVFESAVDCARVSLGSSAPQAEAGKKTTAVVRLGNCGGKLWRGYSLERVAGTAGPTALTVPTVLRGRATALQIPISTPNKVGPSMVTYQLQGPRGPVGDPLEIAVQAIAPSTSRAKQRG
jgi:hypothetical protein